MIQFTDVNFEIDVSDFEMIFFSSPAAVKSFYSYHPDVMLPVCCMGRGTAAVIPSGKNIIFVGHGSTEQVAIEFKKWLSNRQKVLFPIGDRSLRRVQEYLRPEQFCDLQVYTTALHPRPIETADIYIFTSPTNAESFLILNRIPAGAKVISMGKRTQEYLTKQGISSIASLNYRPEGLWYTIFSSTCS